jgi:MarR family transcriptional regulator, negative regulator of the multidrug operon emrRAB
LAHIRRYFHCKYFHNEIFSMETSQQFNMIQKRIEQIEVGLGHIASKWPDFPIAEVLLMRIIVLLSQEFTSLLDRRIRPYGLTEIDYRVLINLFAQPDGAAHPSELCARTAQSPANMTRIADGLVDRNLITRDLSAEDRRRMVLRMTEKGEALVRDMLPTHFASLREAFKDISRDDLQIATGLLKQLAATLGQQTVAMRATAEDR